MTVQAHEFDPIPSKKGSGDRTNPCRQRNTAQANRASFLLILK
jgi:hypothetical protein